MAPKSLTERIKANLFQELHVCACVHATTGLTVIESGISTGTTLEPSSDASSSTTRKVSFPTAQPKKLTRKRPKNPKKWVKNLAKKRRNCDKVVDTSLITYFVLEDAELSKD
uniref:Uncharacterized protein n=1 Tax=Lygus hesperus TaxID=30085 RepID=A0A0K8SN62_LYGHE